MSETIGYSDEIVNWVPLRNLLDLRRIPVGTTIKVQATEDRNRHVLIGKLVKRPQTQGGSTLFSYEMTYPTGRSSGIWNELSTWYIWNELDSFEHAGQPAYLKRRSMEAIYIPGHAALELGYREEIKMKQWIKLEKPSDITKFRPGTKVRFKKSLRGGDYCYGLLSQNTNENEIQWQIAIRPENVNFGGSPITTLESLTVEELSASIYCSEWLLYDSSTDPVDDSFPYAANETVEVLLDEVATTATPVKEKTPLQRNMAKLAELTKELNSHQKEVDKINLAIEALTEERRTLCGKS